MPIPDDLLKKEVDPLAEVSKVGHRRECCLLDKKSPHNHFEKNAIEYVWSQVKRRSPTLRSNNLHAGVYFLNIE